MSALTLLTDMYRHMAWADALVLTTVMQKPEAEGDEYLLAKLRHLHATQRVFLDVWTGRPIDPRVADELDVRALAAFAREVHDGAMQFLASQTSTGLQSVIELPWSKTATKKLGFDVAEHTLADTLVQVPLHSSSHRGQVSARLRELGIDPPMTDYIAWIWRQKPEASWPELS
ncbi:DinB family protein [Chlorobaculum parvum NCIB 8327]|uniref:DinB family protein n=1 Tax=Chlorobaculum parvum (strain DSM 263 / NCIMB 8327) TaxID=517417 RepID=B3QKZ6_CHLP8|nr:DinB family protein [Chlorobaculum parvum]ACF10784.1 DinB family protein [Chlorobaculum parvum NCIB 8327]